MSSDSGGNSGDRMQTKIVRVPSASVPVYGFGFIGAAIYYIQHATTFGMGVVGVLKAMVWPVLLIYKVLDLLEM